MPLLDSTETLFAIGVHCTLQRLFRFTQNDLHDYYLHNIYIQLIFFLSIICFARKILFIHNCSTLLINNIPVNHYCNFFFLGKWGTSGRPFHRFFYFARTISKNLSGNSFCLHCKYNNRSWLRLQKLDFLKWKRVFYTLYEIRKSFTTSQMGSLRFNIVY